MIVKYQRVLSDTFSWNSSWPMEGIFKNSINSIKGIRSQSFLIGSRSHIFVPPGTLV